MARHRRSPQHPIAWLLGVIISVAGTYAVFRVSVSSIEQLGQQRIEQAKALQQKIQQQQQARQHPIVPLPPISPEQLAHQQALDEAERRRQAELAVAARLRQAELAKKDDAWERFYQPPRACMYPESDLRKQVCDASANKAREKFEAAWAAGQLQSQR